MDESQDMQWVSMLIIKVIGVIENKQHPRAPTKTHTSYMAPTCAADGGRHCATPPLVRRGGATHNLFIKRMLFNHPDLCSYNTCIYILHHCFILMFLLINESSCFKTHRVKPTPRHTNTRWNVELFFLSKSSRMQPGAETSLHKSSAILSIFKEAKKAE